MELTPHSVWAKYQKDKDFKKKIDLYEKVKKQENFFVEQILTMLDVLQLQFEHRK